MIVGVTAGTCKSKITDMYSHQQAPSYDRVRVRHSIKCWIRKACCLPDNVKSTRLDLLT